MKKNKEILTLLFLGTLMGALDISIVGPAIPSIEKSLAIPEQFISWIFSIYVLFNLLGISLMARLSDLHGRKKLYAISLGIFGLGSLVVALSNHYGILLAGRAIQGFGASGIFPVASATIGDVFPEEKRGRALGLIGAVFGIAFIIGPLIAGVLLKFFTWHSLFLINIPLAIYLIFRSLKVLPGKGNAEIKKIDWGGIILLGIFLASFTIAINSIHPEYLQESILSLRFMGLTVVSLLSLIAFIYTEGKHPFPILKLAYFRSVQISIAGIVGIATGLFEASFVFFPKVATLAFGVDSSTASFMLIPVVFFTAIGSPLGGRLVDKIGAKSVVVSGLFFSMLGLILLSFWLHTKWEFYIAGMFTGIGLSFLIGSSLRYILLKETPESERATAQGIITIFVSVGQIVGSVLITTLALTGPGLKGFTNAFLVLAGITFLIFLLSFGLRRR